jgi:plastocyanin
MRLPLISAFAVFIISCGGSDSTGTSTGITPNPGGGNTPTVTTSVAMRNTSFTPSAIQVSPGAVVTFTNQDNIDHNATFSSSSIGGTGNFATGSKTVTMPSAPGTYGYQCTLHAGMNGTVVVQ